MEQPSSGKSDEASSPKERYYPGKYIGKAIQKISAARERRDEAKEAGAFERPEHKLVAIKNALKRKRELKHRSSDQGQIGSLGVSVIGGSFYTSRPYFVLELDGNEERTPTAFTSSPSWEGNSQAEFVFPVFDAGADLCVFLFSDDSVHNEQCRARVIIPLRSLCTNALLPMPKPMHKGRYRLMPASRQHSEDLLSHYTEAVPGVPGSGMVKPCKDLGEVELTLHLTLTAPGAEHIGLLAAYASVPPGGRVDEEDASEDEGGDSSPSKAGAEGHARKPDPRAIRYNSTRIKRCIRKPHLLRSPWCFSLPFVLYLVCFHFVAFQMPWVLLVLVVANGALDYSYRGELTETMIFWEDSVGPDQLPHGLEKLRAIFKLLTILQGLSSKIALALERMKNMFNFADAPVTLTAIAVLSVACFAASLLLWLIPLSTIVFALGLAALCPILVTESGVDIMKKDISSSAEPAKAEHEENAVRKAMRMVCNVLARVPDDTDVAHQFFCRHQQVSM